jgi:serine protease
MLESGRSVLVLLLLALFASACGGSATGVMPPSCVGTSAAGVAGPGSVVPKRTGAIIRRPPNLPRYAPDRLLVKFRTGVQAAAVQSLHQQAGGSVIRIIQKLDVHVVRVDTASMARVMTAYRTSPFVEFVENDPYVYAAATPNDSLYSLQWHYPAINLPAAWDVVTGPNCVIVAVLDTGIRPHPDLTWVAGFDFFSNDADPTDPGCSADPNDFSHGMHIAGTIAALTNNAIGVAGVNWGGSTGTQIMPLRVLGESGGTCGVGTASMVADALVYATDNGAKVANMSFGGLASTTLENGVNYAYSRGVTLVAAAGNEGVDMSTSGAQVYPAAYPNVIAVGATACNNTRASYSNFGMQLDLMAPGGDFISCSGDPSPEEILSTSWSPNGGTSYYFGSGTSFSTPHVSGLAVLLIARGIVGPASIQNRLQSTATDRGAPGWDPLYGWGLVNAAAAVGP